MVAGLKAFENGVGPPPFPPGKSDISVHHEDTKVTKKISCLASDIDRGIGPANSIFDIQSETILFLRALRVFVLRKRGEKPHRAVLQRMERRVAPDDADRPVGVNEARPLDDDRAVRKGPAKAEEGDV